RTVDPLKPATQGPVLMEILISAERIQHRVGELAQEISADYRDRPVTIVGVLTGSLIFLADLVRRLDLPLRIGLIQASSYRGAVTTPGELHVQPELIPDVRDRHVLLLDDILDTGQTLSHLAGGLPRTHFQPHVCVLGRWGPVAQTLRSAGVEVTALGWQRPLDLKAWQRLRHTVASFQPEVTHVWQPASLRAVVAGVGRSRG